MVDGINTWSRYGHAINILQRIRLNALDCAFGIDNHIANLGIDLA